jgi:hypothetical protein
MLLSKLQRFPARRWVFRGLPYKEKLLRQCKLHASDLQYVGSYHSKFHSHRTKYKEVIWDKHAGVFQEFWVKFKYY